MPFLEALSALSECLLIENGDDDLARISGSLSLHRQGMPAPHMHPKSLCQARLGWFSHTHPMPKHLGQFSFT
jgi:hypothetical protein